MIKAILPNQRLEFFPDKNGYNIAARAKISQTGDNFSNEKFRLLFRLRGKRLISHMGTATIAAVAPTISSKIATRFVT